MRKLLLFDLDGTLADTIVDIADSINQVFDQNGFDRITYEEAKRFIGNGSRKLMERSLKGMYLDKLDEMVSIYRKIYSECGFRKTVAYPGIHEMLLSLQDKAQLCVVSNKPQKPSEDIVGMLFPDIHFSLIVGQTEKMRVKPDKEPIDYVLKNLNISKDETVMIGDSVIDVQTARNSDIIGVSVLWGYGIKDAIEEAGAVNCANNPEELYNILIKV